MSGRGEKGSAGRPAHEPGSARARGIAKIQEVYGLSVDPDDAPGPYLEVTIDHLFGAIWTRPGLDIRDRRLVTIGVLAALGQPQLVELQLRSALERGELSEEQVREMVVHLAHYIGWPLSTGVNEAAERVIAARRNAERVEQPKK